MELKRASLNGTASIPHLAFKWKSLIVFTDVLLLVDSLKGTLQYYGVCGESRSARHF